MSTITETLKAKLDELDLDRRVDELTEATEKTLRQLLGQVGELAHDNRERVSTLLDKAGTALDERTDGRYTAQFGKVREQVVAGVDKLATKRPANAFEGEAGEAFEGEAGEAFEESGAEAARPLGAESFATEGTESTEGPQDTPAGWADVADSVEREQPVTPDVEESNAPSSWGNHTRSDLSTRSRDSGDPVVLRAHPNWHHRSEFPHD